MLCLISYQISGRSKKTYCAKSFGVTTTHPGNDSNAESDIELDTDVYDLHEDNRNNSESESLSDNELLVSELSNSEILDFKDTETNSKTDEDHVHQNNTTSFATTAGIAWDLLGPNQSNC